jgi:hypothetical protein
MNEEGVHWREEKESQFPFRGGGVDLGKSPSCIVGNQKHYVQWLHARMAFGTVAHQIWWLQTGVN